MLRKFLHSSFWNSSSDSSWFFFQVFLMETFDGLHKKVLKILPEILFARKLFHGFLQKFSSDFPKKINIIWWISASKDSFRLLPRITTEITLQFHQKFLQHIFQKNASMNSFHNCSLDSIWTFSSLVLESLLGFSLKILPGCFRNFAFYISYFMCIGFVSICFGNVPISIYRSLSICFLKIFSIQESFNKHFKKNSTRGFSRSFSMSSFLFSKIHLLSKTWMSSRIYLNSFRYYARDSWFLLEVPQDFVNPFRYSFIFFW